MFVGCSSLKSSGAGTNILAVLGADSRLVLVGPARVRCRVGARLQHTGLVKISGAKEDRPVSQVLMFCGALD